MSSWTVVPKGTINVIKTKHALGLNAISIAFPDDFKDGTVQLKDCEILTESAISGLHIDVTMWNIEGMLVHVRIKPDTTKTGYSGNNPFKVFR